MTATGPLVEGLFWGSKAEKADAPIGAIELTASTPIAVIDVFNAIRVKRKTLRFRCLTIMRQVRKEIFILSVPYPFTSSEICASWFKR